MPRDLPRRSGLAVGMYFRHTYVVKNMTERRAAAGVLPSPALRPSAEGSGPADVRTRDRVAQLLLEQGPSTAVALGEALGLSAPAIRRHLDSLLAEGRIAEREPRALPGRGRGRPAKVYALTDAGRGAFPHAYDDLAVQALRFLRSTGGEPAVEAFAAARVAGLAARLRIAASGRSTLVARAEAVAATLTQDGYAATSAPGPLGLQLCQHHCPVVHVAAEFPQLCEAETHAIALALGTHVQRLATIAHGDGVCTTYLPSPSPGPTGSAPPGPPGTGPPQGSTT